MRYSIIGPVMQVLLAAVFFGASAPLSKPFLADVPPILVAAFLYLGSRTEQGTVLSGQLSVFSGGVEKRA